MRHGLWGLKNVLGALVVAATKNDRHGALVNGLEDLRLLYLDLKWGKNMQRCTFGDFQGALEERGHVGPLETRQKARAERNAGMASNDVGQWASKQAEFQDQFPKEKGTRKGAEGSQSLSHILHVSRAPFSAPSASADQARRWRDREGQVSGPAISLPHRIAGNVERYG
ncbi:hypothetical protein HO173_009278 [Letharia columbiana]|uniref:Uncharacterized protein n=1 Tax=Letharia columbiana TaxID=112416 RepID=A0A8H6L223_9LECA|nr:uncharacterized protein HO173_009278 [Letharia columbiana]KAF6232610.1 hypothetical protein HO173_009278 [Letharia columbiana]